MTGLFHTAPESAPAVFSIGQITCTKTSVGPMDNNAYLLSCDDALILIDAADCADRLLELIGSCTLDAVITTHQHADHIQALASIIDATGAQSWAGKPDSEAIQKTTGVSSLSVWSHDAVTCGSITLGVIGLVGHTPGSIALVLDPQNGSEATHIFTGDSLFPGGVGKTDSPADFACLLNDVTHEIFESFDDQTIIHPGHGDSTTLGDQRPHLYQWRTRGW